MDDVVLQLGKKFRSLDDQLEFLTSQLNLQQRFLKYKFEREFEEFVDAPERFETSGSCRSGDQDTRNASVAADADSLSSAETYGLEGTSLTNLQDEDFEEEKFHPLGFIEPAEPEFVNAMRLSDNGANKEVPSDLEPPTAESFEESNPSSAATSTAAIPSSSSNGPKRIQQKKQVEEKCGEKVSRSPSPMKLRKRERNPTIKGSGRTTLDDNFENVAGTGEETDSLASGGTSVDSSSSQESESDSETETKTRRRRFTVGFAPRKTSPTVNEALRVPTPSESSTVHSHKQNRPNEKRLKCSVCPKRFLTSSHLSRHELIHTNEKPHKCSYCDKSFREVGTLRCHELIHTNEKPFDCTYCDMSFRVASNLRRHELIHTNEKPHKCSHCEKSFRQSTHLRSHELIHTSSKPYKCAFCPKMFREKYPARRHERVHQTPQ